MGWDYEPGFTGQLSKNVDALLSDTRNLPANTVDLHRRMFNGLPSDEIHYAGGLRGSQHPDLLHYSIMGGSPPFQITYAAPSTVYGLLQEFHKKLARVFQAMDALRASQDPPEQRALKAALWAALTFAEFIEIHPFANGNGHIARLLVVVMMARAGFYMGNWVDPRPGPKGRYACATIYAVQCSDATRLALMIRDAIKGVERRF